MTTLSLPDRPTAPEAIAQLLRREILAGRWSPGERLPAERDLAQQLGITRVTVRSALSALSAEGLVEARQGSGTRVRDYRLGGGPGLLPAMAEEALRCGEIVPLVRDMLVVRRGLAREVLTRLGEEPPSAEALAKVDSAVARFGACVASLPEGGSAPGAASLLALAEADLSVLRAIVEATGSAVFQLAVNPIGEALAALPVLRAAVYRSPGENLAGWQALALWLRTPDLDNLPVFLGLLEERDRQTLVQLATLPVSSESPS